MSQSIATITRRSESSSSYGRTGASGIGVLASVSSSLFGGRAAPSAEVIQRFSAATQQPVVQAMPAAA